VKRVFDAGAKKVLDGRGKVEADAEYALDSAAAVP